LDAVDWPEGGLVLLFVVGGVKRVDDGAFVDERELVWMVIGEGDVSRGVPVPGGDAEGEPRCGEELVD